MQVPSLRSRKTPFTSNFQQRRKTFFRIQKSNLVSTLCFLWKTKNSDAHLYPFQTRKVFYPLWTVGLYAPQSTVASSYCLSKQRRRLLDRENLPSRNFLLQAGLFRSVEPVSSSLRNSNLWNAHCCKLQHNSAEATEIFLRSSEVGLIAAVNLLVACNFRLVPAFALDVTEVVCSRAQSAKDRVLRVLFPNR